MILCHYSRDPFVFDQTRVYRGTDHFKPHGLWLSVESDEPDWWGWREWCEAENFNREGLAHRTVIELSPDANVLKLAMVGEIDAFTHHYKAPARYSGDTSIDWPLIVRRYDGIIIAPYQWERRLAPHTFWYYTWDCASACVWNPAVINVLQETR